MRGNKIGTRLWCISLPLHFRKSSVGTVDVSFWVPSLPPAAGPGLKKASIGKGWVEDSLGTSWFCCTAEPVAHLPLIFVPSTVLGLLLSLHNTQHLLGAVMLERTGYTGQDWLYWWELPLVLVLPALSALWLYHLLESTISESTVLKHHYHFTGKAWQYSRRNEAIFYLGYSFLPLQRTGESFVCQSIPSALTAGGQLCKTMAGSDA